MCQISIVVPVYNAKEKLQRCVNALLRQQNCTFEIILVDDGSSDQSGIICDRISEKEPRVKTFHQENKGAAAARNTGIRSAVGEYIAFCDADDMVSEQWLSRMLQYADKGVLPIGGYCSKESDLKAEKKLRIERGKVYPIAAYWELQKNGLAGYLWNALYSRKVIMDNGLFIPERKELDDINEDLSFALKYVSYMDYVVYTGYMEYLYDTHEGSLSRKNQDLYFLKYSEKYLLWRQFLIEYYHDDEKVLADLADAFVYHFLISMDYQIQTYCFAGFKKIVLSKEMQDCIRMTNTERENRRVIRLIKNKNVIVLWCYLVVSKIKGGHRK